MVDWITLPKLADYQKTLELMENKVNQLLNKSATETIYLVEHPDVYTAGTNFKADELLKPDKIPVIYTGRGGKFTYHGPGQRVIYPILNLSAANRKKDLKLYIRLLEQWVINSLLHFGIKAYTAEERVGIWVNVGGEQAKIAAIGVRVKKWITYHGLAINISPDLSKFSGIIACGLANFSVTSLKQLGVEIPLEKFDQVLKSEFDRVFL